MERRSIENELNLSWHWDGPSVNFFAKASQVIGVAFYILNVYIYVKG